MTEEEAVEFLKERLEVASGYPEVKEYSEALKVAIQAVEKQVPKKIIRKKRLMEHLTDARNVKQNKCRLNLSEQMVQNQAKNSHGVGTADRRWIGVMLNE